jgi:hypothetical protein
MDVKIDRVTGIEFTLMRGIRKRRPFTHNRVYMSLVSFADPYDPNLDDDGPGLPIETGIELQVEPNPDDSQDSLIPGDRLKRAINAFNKIMTE